ncbi:MAG: TonB family protein [Candidatus Omnitrophota bacterium]
MRKSFLSVILVLAAITMFPLQQYASDSIDEEIKLYMGELKVIPVNGIARIAIGNPAVADVVNVAKTEITISPKAPGTTTLVYWDLYGEQSYKLKVFAEDITEAKRRVDNLLSKLDLPGVYAQAEEDEGKVLLLGTVKEPQDREKIALALGTLKDKTVDLITVKEEETAVEIDVQVLELDKDATKTLGFTNPLQGTTSITEVGSDSLTSVWWTRIFRVANVKRDTAFNWTITMLEQEGKARILSRPRLACQSGKEAELSIGGEKPVFTTDVASAGGEGTSVDYKEFGIKLKIKPTVTTDNRIKVALNVEISEVGVADTIGAANAPTAKAYPLTKRTVSTELFLDDGQTLAVGGLIKQKQEESLTKTPWLADLPVVGGLFRKRSTTTGGGFGEKGNTELFITLTPKIVGRQIDAASGQTEKSAAGKSSITSPAAESLMGENVPAEMKSYVRIIQKRILDNISYPVSAKEAGFQGTVKLSLHLSYLGQLIDATVKQSSGYKILDDNAVTTSRQLISYPPFPPSIDKKDLWIDIPILYRLD